MAAYPDDARAARQRASIGVPKTKVVLPQVDYADKVAEKKRHAEEARVAYSQMMAKFNR